ncbi:MAG: GNAT family N-acetyltransferase [Clostridia bacterium]|nr:GNAT family N-acetyltransferase [Clostridia bacterium]
MTRQASKLPLKNYVRPENKPVGLLYGHISERACRVDYLLVSKKHRMTGVGRTLFYHYMEWCQENGMDNIYIWPDGDTPKRIYEEGSFRVMETRKAGRAVFEANGNKTRC